ncbi:NADP-dependent 3-hydroxy acid dehydrogenase YdfG [Solirubrobacter pauli]|uniref:NADP-dependent 3-hydroxy acid dehydrogenase YdfG n=1 Tax=Solirubrobacter pauli TaxID=166793 RepID=A0A660KXE3_9ACTN|nr:SDR family NAD(P)-dependent oxidoreductase [Solirubrobacter pauli]RKQ86387.1 NADP-dependent 3-hydroxy acid dehydrogenase YdfG [Solirubrobacter pauli]
MPQTWLITGSSRGLGRALAEAAVAAGHNVVATARRPVDLEGAYPVALDVTDAEQARAAVAAAVERFGRLDVVVNNAGYANVSSIEDFAEEDFRAQLETNLWGVVNVTRAALPVLREQGAGHIIQISSVGGRSSAPGLGPYQTAKWAVEGFSGVLAKEVNPLGIKVTVVEPGGFRTDWAGSSMTVQEFNPAYDASVGAMMRYRESAVALGDPVKAAQAILTVADAEEPPLQLLLGSDAFALARSVDEARIASDDRWKPLTLSTDHDDADPAGIERARELTASRGTGSRP